MDSLSKEKRSWNMSHIKSKNTMPELLVRSLLHRAGYRFRLHVKELPGKPDIVLPKYKTIIEVRGCFWHHHEGCTNAKIPDTRQDWWSLKLAGNKARDKENRNALLCSGWHLLVIWDCLLKEGSKSQKISIKSFILDAVARFVCNNTPYAELASKDFDLYTQINLSRKEKK